MDLKELVRVSDSVEVQDASYEDIGRNYARKWFSEKKSDEGFEESFARWRYRNKEESVKGAKDEMALLMRKEAMKRDPSTRDKATDDEKKEELYKLTEQFVRKYQPQYYKQYKGDLQDLVSDFYAEFTTKKSRVAGKEESLLDKYDENITSFPYLVKVAVQRMLIDRSRKDKGERNITEKYDEETGELSLDYLASTDPEDDNDIQLEDIEFSDEQILELRDRWDEMSDEQKKPIINYYNEVKNVLAPNFKKLFADIIEGKVSDSDDQKISKVETERILKMFAGGQDIDGIVWQTRVEENKGRGVIELIVSANEGGEDGVITIGKDGKVYSNPLTREKGVITALREISLRIEDKLKEEHVVDSTRRSVVDMLAEAFKISDAEKVELGKDKPYSMYELQNKPPKWVDDLILWDEIVKKATHDGEKEVKIVVPLSMYKRAKKSDESEGKKSEFSLEDLKDKAPSWAKDKDLWDEIIKKATHNGDKEVKYIVPLSMYKKASKVNDSEDFSNFISHLMALNTKVRLDLPLEGTDAQVELDCDPTGWDIEMVIDGDRRFIASGEGMPSEADAETLSYINQAINSVFDEFSELDS